MRRRLAALAAAALAAAGTAAVASGRVDFAPNDPLAPRQWYLVQDRAFDTWTELPALPGNGVRVAVVDSGVDGNHPEFAGKIVAARSFVGGNALSDQHGHGTFVAGEIAAATGNGQGIAGIAFPAQLVVAKVVRADRSIPVDAEVAAIRWAVAQHARVINLSLGGLRDPQNSSRDTFSPAEARAIDYAVAHGTLVVAAVGNSDQAPRTPWPYASYPAALPHVLGVSALARDGSVPSFSDRDAVFDDMAAPGEDIVSTLPLRLSSRPGCPYPGYSDCSADDEYRHAGGTSFSAPQAAAAAALLFATNPQLAPEQVATLLERSADDLNAATGCRRCRPGRDALSGWGRLDIAGALAALQAPLPPVDRFEPNDEAGTRAPRLYGASIRVRATLDYWDDAMDVYRVRVPAGTTLDAAVQGPARASTSLLLWRPGTQTVAGTKRRVLRMRLATAAAPGPNKRLAYRAPSTGWYYVEVKLASAGSGQYSLTLTKR